MAKINLTTKNIGDRINFKIAARYGWAKGPRVIRKVYPKDGFVTVRCAGHADFIVHFREITELIPREVQHDHK